MNWSQLRAFLWLEWRLRVNQFRRSGLAGVIVLTILAAGAVVLSVTAFFLALFVGQYAFRRISADALPAVLMYAWDGVVVAFLFCWMIGLMTELQRADLMSLEKFLHLPVSLSGAFLINYISSLASFSLVLFVPAMVGFSIALVVVHGATMLWMFPLAAGFLLMVTSLTFQLRGWIASLMVNKRRRRTVITAVTATIILLAQAPNLINFLVGPWRGKRADAPAVSVIDARMIERKNELIQAERAGEITATEHAEELEALANEVRARNDEKTGHLLARIERTATIVNLAAPPGWLPYGAKALAERRVLPAVLATLAFALVGAASLRRSYRTTVRIYTGVFSSSRMQAGAREQPSAAESAVPRRTEAKPSIALLEKRLPWVSEHASAIAAACFRSITRAPEAKMMLLTPFIMVVVFGGMLMTRTSAVPPFARPLMASGAVVMVLFGMMQLVGNLFGFDRSGFRTFVLSSAPRRDILLGKNLAFAPLALGVATFILAILQCIYPMRADHFIASLAQMFAMFFVFCLVANLLSIIAPVPIAAGTLKSTRPKAMTILVHIVFVFAFPLALAPTMLPLGVEYLFRRLGWLSWAPVYLVLSLTELIAVAGLYWIVVTAQGQMLHRREQQILEVVTAKVE